MGTWPPALGRAAAGAQHGVVQLAYLRLVRHGVRPGGVDCGGAGGRLRGWGAAMRGLAAWVQRGREAAGGGGSVPDACRCVQKQTPRP